MGRKTDVLIVGGGTGGIAVAARLAGRLHGRTISIIEPADIHYYQPLWTLVGGGIFRVSDSARPMASQIPGGVCWIKDRAASFDPAGRTVTMATGEVITYEYLILSPGMQVNWSAIKGLQETIGQNGVCSNYAAEYAPYTFECLQNLRGGNAVFTFPATPVKCAGAPQKIMYLAEDYTRKYSHVREQCRFVWCSASPTIFGVKKYADALNRHIQDRGINTNYKWNLVEIDGPGRKAVFETGDNKQRQELEFAMLHVAPPMSAPDFVRKSPLVDSAGWIEVNKSTLQHVRWPEIFALGDASSLPTSRTGAAIRKQAPVLVENLLSQMAGRPLTATYNGYTSCPLITAYGRLILAEFDYDGNPVETFPFDQSKERLSMYLLKKHVLPPMYWHGMMRGRM